MRRSTNVPREAACLFSIGQRELKDDHNYSYNALTMIQGAIAITTLNILRKNGLDFSVEMKQAEKDLYGELE